MLKPKLPKPETAKPEDRYIFTMKPKGKRSSLSAWLRVFRFLFWIDRGDLDRPRYETKSAKPPTETQSEDDLGDEHQLLADNENEENESLFW